MSSITKFQYEQMLARVGYKLPNPLPPESDLHNQIMDHCDHQWPRWKYVHSRMDKATRNAVGVFDFVIALPRQTVWVEAKRPGQKLTPAQRAFKAELDMLNVPAFVVYDMNDFLDQVGPYLSNPTTKTKTPSKV